MQPLSASQSPKIPETAVVATLRELLATCRDAERGYQHAAELADDASIKELFARRHVVRQELALALKDALYRHGKLIETDHGTVLGTIHRGVLDAMARVRDGRLHALVSECERGERVAIAVYQDALSKALPEDVRLLVEDHLATFTHDRDELRDLLAGR